MTKLCCCCMSMSQIKARFPHEQRVGCRWRAQVTCRASSLSLTLSAMFFPILLHNPNRSFYALPTEFRVAAHVRAADCLPQPNRNHKVNVYRKWPCGSSARAWRSPAPSLRPGAPRRTANRRNESPARPPVNEEGGRPSATRGRMNSDGCVA